MKKILLALLALTMGLTSCVEDKVYNPGEVIIPESPLMGKLTLNEINGNGGDADKYIELYNNSDAAISLAGITIGYHNAGTPDYAITWAGASGQSIAPRAFLLLKGRVTVGGVLNTGLSAAQGIFVRVLDADEKLIDLFTVVAKESRPGYAATSNTSFARIPDGAGLWYFEDETGTQGVTNGTDHTGLIEIVQAQPPTIENVAISPVAPTPTDAVTVSATVMAGEGTLTSVSLSYTLSTDAEGTAPHTVNATINGNVYSWTIPAQANLTLVSYTIEAINSRPVMSKFTGNYLVSAAATVTGVSTSPVAPLIGNAVTVTATLTKGSATSFEMVYNAGAADVTVAMSRVGTTSAYTGTIPASAITATGAVTYSFQVAATPATRTGNFEFYVPTATSAFLGLVINEIDGNGKFVELYNKGTAPISLTGITLVKNGAGTWWTGVAALGTLAPGAFISITNGETTPANPDLVGASGISAKQNLQFQLIDPASIVLDNFLRSNGGALGAGITPDYGTAMPTGGGIFSFSRCPDGVGAFGLAVPSKNAANPAIAAGPIISNP